MRSERISKFGIKEYGFFYCKIRSHARITRMKDFYKVSKQIGHCEALSPSLRRGWWGDSVCTECLSDLDWVRNWFRNGTAKRKNLKGRSWRISWWLHALLVDLLWISCLQIDVVYFFGPHPSPLFSRTVISFFHPWRWRASSGFQAASCHTPLPRR